VHPEPGTTTGKNQFFCEQQYCSITKYTARPPQSTHTIQVKVHRFYGVKSLGVGVLGAGGSGGVL
jgi:hypothetical protein